jgi:Pup amidohydrolase
MFDRLLGLETEYAVGFRPRKPRGPRIPNAILFERVVKQVGAKVPIVPAIIREFGWYTASGGAFRLERNPFLGPLPAAGLLEGATPECRGPRQLLLYQRAQDALLSRALANSGGDDGEAALLKNNRDAQGHGYGSHENYEATVASWLSLLVWRLGLVFLIPTLLLPTVLLIVASFALLAALYIPVLALSVLSGRVQVRAGLWEPVVDGVFGLVLLPIALVVGVFIWLTGFRRVRRQMLAFLVSRPVIAGTGTVGPDGRFGLSPRALSIRLVTGVAAECYRPVYYFGHVVKCTLGVLLGDWWGYARLFHKRQRFQIGIGDSNMCQTAEYLKLGTTLLVLEAIEAGALAGAPRLRRPVTALRAICADPGLKTSVLLVDGRRWTALEIQRFYLNACKDFVARTCPGHGEAETVLRLWEEMLDGLERDPRQTFGKIDWVTKRSLLEELGPDAPIEARRKIDLRYHELTKEGYYLRLEAASIAPTLVEPEEVLAAIQVPPQGTPAAIRGRLIRESQGNVPLRAGWNAVIIGEGKGRRVIRLPAHGCETDGPSVLPDSAPTNPPSP